MIPTEHVCSPDRGYGYSACYVRSSGAVYSGYDSVYDSYGQADYWWLRSPDRDDFYIALYVFPDGDISSDYNRNINDSYGSLRFSASASIHIWSLLVVMSIVMAVTMCTIPTKLYSPHTVISDNFPYCVGSSGWVDNGISYSYGNLSCTLRCNSYMNVILKHTGFMHSEI